MKVSSGASFMDLTMGLLSTPGPDRPKNASPLLRRQLAQANTAQQEVAAELRQSQVDEIVSKKFRRVLLTLLGVAACLVIYLWNT